MKGSNLSWSLVCAAVSCLLLILSGCGSAADTGPLSNGEEQGPGISVKAAALSNSDVKKVKFVLKKKYCGAAPATKSSPQTVFSKVKWLNPLKLPDGFKSLKNNPYDEGSHHLFADLFKVLEADCHYEVWVKALDSNGDKIETCSKAHSSFHLDQGELEEQLLIINCETKKQGTGDFLGTINHSPVIKFVKHKILGRKHNSKFVRCGDKVAVCFKAKDPDYDPLKSKVWIHGRPIKKAKKVPHKFLKICKHRCKNKGRYCFKRCLHYLIKKRKKYCHKRCKKKCNGKNGPQTQSKRKHCYRKRYRRCYRRSNKGLAQCILLKPKKRGKRIIKLKVKDLAWTEKNGNTSNANNTPGWRKKKLVPIEDLAGTDSHVKIRIPLHVGGQCYRQRP